MVLDEDSLVCRLAMMAWGMWVGASAVSAIDLKPNGGKLIRYDSALNFLMTYRAVSMETLLAVLVNLRTDRIRKMNKMSAD